LLETQETDKISGKFSKFSNSSPSKESNIKGLKLSEEFIIDRASNKLKDDVERKKSVKGNAQEMTDTMSKHTRGNAAFLIPDSKSDIK
jgi:hypothetical protein